MMSRVSAAPVPEAKKLVPTELRRPPLGLIHACGALQLVMKPARLLQAPLKLLSRPAVRSV